MRNKLNFIQPFIYIILLLLGILISINIVKNKSFQKAIQLAIHLSSKDIIMYSAYWCPFCHDQKELFGKEACKILNIVECAKDSKDSQYQLCDAKEIRGFPCWEIDGKIYVGFKSLKKLAELSQYPNPEQFNQ